MEIDDEDVKIKIRFPKKDGKILARATIIVKTTAFGYIDLNGFIIWQSEHLHPLFQEAINITPPSIRKYAQYVKIVFVEEINKWQLLEQKIYDAYCLAKNSQVKKLSQDVDPEDIPI